MKNPSFFSRLKPSTRAYVVTFIAGLLGPIHIPSEMSLAMEFINLAFAIFGVVAIVAFFVGLQRSWREAKEPKAPEMTDLDEKVWYRALKVVGYILLFIGAMGILGSDVGGKFLPYVVLYICFTRILKFVFFYILLNQKDIRLFF